MHEQKDQSDTVIDLFFAWIRLLLYQGGSAAAKSNCETGFVVEKTVRGEMMS